MCFHLKKKQIYVYSKVQKPILAQMHKCVSICEYVQVCKCVRVQVLAQMRKRVRAQIGKYLLKCVGAQVLARMRISDICFML